MVFEWGARALPKHGVRFVPAETTLIEVKPRGLDRAGVGLRLPQKSRQKLERPLPFPPREKPFFVVSEEKQIFHCFGCHEGGDIFGFLMKMEGLTFPEAVERLAERAHVALSPKAGPTLSKDEKENFFQANRVAAWHYYENLKKSPAAERARAYLKERGISEAEIEKFRLGFALPHSDELKNIFEERKVPLEAALKVGVLRQGERGYYESFRGRLIFPIFNRENKVVGLGGRILESNPEVAKYINSSDSPIYDKSATLFALPLAKEAIRRKNRVFVVEGYLDAITLHQFGFRRNRRTLGHRLNAKTYRVTQALHR
ncbi:MAG: CHC2 zinc finger domain-containing protein [bacterium]